MRLVDRLALDLVNTYDGPAWHGTSLRRMVADVDEQTAQARPIASARTIAELTAHVASWIGIVERRLRGEVFDVPQELDFPPGDAVPFTQLLEEMDAAYQQLLQTLRSFDDALLDEPVAGKSYTNWTMIVGLMHHSTYHAAQIAVLKKR
jgi:uncharacterized damage-inducible protein DinB